MEIKLFRRALELRSAFRIAHGSYSYRESVFLWLREGGHIGMGEAPVVPYYGVPADAIEEDLARNAPSLAAPALDGSVLPAGGFAYAASRCAFQEAILSLRARREGSSLAAAIGLEAGLLPPPTSYTVAYDDDIGAMVATAVSCGFRRLKIKVGIPGDVERVASIREALPGAIIRVDANQGWSATEAPAKIEALERLGVELVEEPIAGDLSALGAIASATSVPILLDESARDAEQVRRCAKEAPGVAGIVVKAAKNGGPAASLELVRAAREAGMKVMVSSMVETSLGASAALALAPLCEWCDLDAPLLVANDPFRGLSYEGEAPRTGPFGALPGPALAAEIEAMPQLGAWR